MSQDVFWSKEIKVGLAQALTFLTLVLETIVGVILFLTWTIIMHWNFINPEVFMALQWVELGLLVGIFSLTFLILYSRLSNFILPLRKVFLTGFLSLLSLTAVELASISRLQVILGGLYPLPSVLFILFLLQGYFIGFFVKKKELGELLQSDTPTAEGVKELLRRRVELSKKIYYSLIGSLSIWGVAVAISHRGISKGKGLLSILAQHLPSVMFLIIFGFLIILGLCNFFRLGRRYKKDYPPSLVLEED